MVHLSNVISAALVVAGIVNGAAIEKRYWAQKNSASPKVATPKAIYFMTNDANANSIVALPIAADGTLTDGSITATGGAGSAEVDAVTKQSTVPDAISSQGSIRVVGNLLFAVNAGSNTLTMMKISRRDPTKLTMLGQPVDTLGEFPVTIGVSAKSSTVCVGNTGAKSGVACAKFCSKFGLTQMDALRDFGLNQSTPPTGPFNTVANSFFSADEKILFTTVKGDPTKNNTGFLSAFPMLGPGCVSMKETPSSPQGSAVLFGTLPIKGTTDLLFTDASFGAGIMSIDQNGAGTIKASSKIADQKATCWTAISEVSGTGFVTDVAANHLVEMDLTTGEIIKETLLTTTNPGLIDIIASGNFMYALSPGSANISSAVAVFDVSGGKGTAKQIQNFNPKGVAITAQGMAVRA
jgi:hypothetical protein